LQLCSFQWGIYAQNIIINSSILSHPEEEEKRTRNRSKNYKCERADLVELQDEGVKGKVKKLCGATAVVI
jgi:hypothetical protein